jgi:hypothetical protein
MNEDTWNAELSLLRDGVWYVDYHRLGFAAVAAS